MRILFVHPEVQDDLFRVGLQLTHLHTRCTEHGFGSQSGIGICVLVAEIDDFPDAGLNDGFGALIAREEGYVERSPLQRLAAGIEDGVEFRMDDVGVLGVFAGAFPWENIVGAILWKTVVSGGNDDVVLVHDAGTHLCVGVFAALCCQQGNPHEVFIPRNIICSFHSVCSPFGSVGIDRIFPTIYKIILQYPIAVIKHKNVFFLEDV